MRSEGSEVMGASEPERRRRATSGGKRGRAATEPRERPRGREVVERRRCASLSHAQRWQQLADWARMQREGEVTPTRARLSMAEAGRSRGDPAPQDISSDDDVRPSLGRVKELTSRGCSGNDGTETQYYNLAAAGNYPSLTHHETDLRGSGAGREAMDIPVPRKETRLPQDETSEDCWELPGEEFREVWWRDRSEETVQTVWATRANPNRVALYAQKGGVAMLPLEEYREGRRR